MPLGRERFSLLITSPWNYTDSGRIKPSGSTFVSDFGQKIGINFRKESFYPDIFKLEHFDCLKKQCFHFKMDLNV